MYWQRELSVLRRFHKTMPGLHFLSKKKTSSTPTPLLLAAILHVSALHSPSPDFAVLAPGYFVAVCCAISELAVPIQEAPRYEQTTGTPRLNDEQRAFQNVLGLILAGLISEAFIETTGLWISMGYRLTLDHCPVHIDERSHEWRGLFSGLQVIRLHSEWLSSPADTFPDHRPRTCFPPHVMSDPAKRSTTAMLKTAPDRCERSLLQPHADDAHRT